MSIKGKHDSVQPGRYQRGVVSRFVDGRQKLGKYGFTDLELAAFSPQTAIARRAALGRLHRVGRIVRPLPRHQFFVVVPYEHHSAGAPPLAWYLDELMRFLGLPDYYVGLLSAAQWHGASHFAVQETQVIASRQMRPIRVGRESVRFFTKATAAATPVEVRTVEGGTVRVSTPEATAVDLLRYPDAAGGLNLVATVLTELAPRLRAAALPAAAAAMPDSAAAQRLGFVLEQVVGERLTGPLARWIAVRRPRLRPLDPGASATGAPVVPRWRLQVNATVEAGL